MNASTYRKERDLAREQLASITAERNVLAMNNQRLSAIVESEDRLLLVEENEKLRHDLSAEREANALLMEQVHSARETIEDILNKRAGNKPQSKPIEMVEGHIERTDSEAILVIGDQRVSVKVGRNWILYRDSERIAAQLGAEDKFQLPKAAVNGFVERVAV